jgi:signal transduction histidine kinase
LISSKQLTIVRNFSFDGELPLVQQDVERIVYNIILNAIQYTPNGKHIYLLTELMDDALVFSVRDEGIGIAASDIPHVFDRFWRADTSRSRVSGGVGLGLSIARTFADRMGVGLSCESAVGVGTVMRCVFPLRVV